MGRLASASVDVKGLIDKAGKGDRTATVELANTYKCENVRELLGVICPLTGPSVDVFDCAADAMTLKLELDARRAACSESQVTPTRRM